MDDRKLYNQAIVDKLQEMVNNYPEWRFGQILCNSDIITFSFGEDHPIANDPFYEESKDTWEKMIKNKYCFPE